MFTKNGDHDHWKTWLTTALLLAATAADFWLSMATAFMTLVLAVPLGTGARVGVTVPRTRDILSLAADDSHFNLDSSFRNLFWDSSVWQYLSQQMTLSL